MEHRSVQTLGLALAAALFVLAAPAVSDAACRAKPNGVCVHPGAACHPPRPGACQTVGRPTPFRHRYLCLCGTPGKRILLP
ncbi:MAG TPA: hypothetical protein VN814_17555 [Caulobacteraceae bacterium]|nr:hypothetical protein [Caulobacteraceae bacterium]